jgi:hypothetical protein
MTLRRKLTHLLAGGTSLMIVTSSCDHACSRDSVERAPKLALPTIESPSGLELPAIDPVQLGAGLQTQAMTDSPLPEPRLSYASEKPKPKPNPKATEIDALEIEDGHTAPPTSSEWFAQKPLHTTHARCFARVVREWMSIHCVSPANRWLEPMGIVRVLAGDATEVQQWTHVAPLKEDDAFPHITAAAIFPVRRGDRRLLEIAYVSHGAHQRFDTIEAYTISVAWLEGMKSPDVTVTE